MIKKHLKVWISIILACLMAFTIYVTTTIKGQRADVIDKIKKECNLVHKEIGTSTIIYTYACDDGVEYTFEELIR